MKIYLRVLSVIVCLIPFSAYVIFISVYGKTEVLHTVYNMHGVWSYTYYFIAQIFMLIMFGLLTMFLCVFIDDKIERFFKNLN